MLKGIEVHILEDGRLCPTPCCSGWIWSSARCTTTTGRLIGEREPCDVELARVLRHATQRACFLELDAQPQRQDLDDSACQLAQAEGVHVSIDSDAHGVFDLDDLEQGIVQARRGWLARDDVLNTRTLGALGPLLARTV